MGNFEFLEKVNPCIANLANTAEKLFRDEYYDQCIAQTRKMAETMTRNVLGSQAEEDDTFDDMIYKLKTISNNNFREQEFISDMYFLKKHGNVAVHSENSANSGKLALECLEHAFEASVNYAYAITHSDKINRLIFDEKLLVLGEKNTSLQEEYLKRLDERAEVNQKNGEQEDFSEEKTNEKITQKTADIPLKPKKSQPKPKKINEKEEKVSNPLFSNLFKKALIVSTFIMLFILFGLFVISKISEKPVTKKIQQTKPAVVKTTVRKTAVPVKKFSITDTFSEMK